MRLCVCVCVCVFLVYELLFLVFLTVPIGPPVNFDGVSIDPTILTLSWEDPEESRRNGAIIRYFYLCEIVHSEAQETQEMTADVTGLTAYQQYICHVAAATINGTGPSATIIRRTAEDSTSRHCFLFGTYCCVCV